MTATAPDAPGRLGEPADPQRLLAYLDALSQWLASRRAELDQLDAAVQASAHAADLTGDIRLGLTLWQAIRSRTDALLRTWDSGRVGPTEREQLSRLIWSRLDTPGGAASGSGLAGLSVPEACRTSDALTAQLRERLQLDPSGSAVLVRLRDLRAGLERLRDQVALEPAQGAAAARTTLDVLAARVQVVAEKAARGGDVGGLLGPLEQESATFERDLIVGGSLRRQNAGLVARMTASRQALGEREARLRDLVARTVATVTPAPRYAVPQVENLGPVPAAAPDLDAYERRLAQVARALDLVEASYSAALAEPARLAADLDAVASGSLDDALAALVAAARGVLARRPIPLDAARSLVEGCRAYAAGGGRAGEAPA